MQCKYARAKYFLCAYTYVYIIACQHTPNIYVFCFDFLYLLSCDYFKILLLESSSYKANEDSNPTRADKVVYSHHQIGIPTEAEMEKLYNTKYFIIKSLNHQNIHLSIEKGVWATQIMNEPILEEAFHVRSLLL